MQADTLVGFCKPVGVGVSDLVAADTYSGFVLSKEIEAKKLQRITADSVRSLMAAFGATLFFSISVPGDDPMLEVKEGKAYNLGEAMQDLRQREPTATLRFELSIDKEHTANELGLDNSQYRVVHFIFKDAFLSFLKKSTLTDLDRLLYKESSTQTVVIVSEASYLYKGDLLTIGGLGLLDKMKSDLRPTGVEVKGLERIPYVFTA